jgi:hypothetical protein
VVDAATSPFVSNKKAATRFDVLPTSANRPRLSETSASVSNAGILRSNATPGASPWSMTEPKNDKAQHVRIPRAFTASPFRLPSKLWSVVAMRKGEANPEGKSSLEGVGWCRRWAMFLTELTGDVESLDLMRTFF